MNAHDLRGFKQWFDSYTRSFLEAHPYSRRNFSLKIEHTYNVCRDILLIAGGQHLDGDGDLVAETVALFHDLGRFPQFALHKTFRDSLSVNHGKLGAEVLLAEGPLTDLPTGLQQLIVDVVRFHNAFSLPELEDPKTLLFLRMVRDADKLDIWRVFLELYESGNTGQVCGLVAGITGRRGFSEEVISRLSERQLIPLSLLRTVDDLKLLQLSWVYDLQFPSTARLALDRRIIERFTSILPRNGFVKDITCRLFEYTVRNAGRTGQRKNPIS